MTDRRDRRRRRPAADAIRGSNTAGAAVLALLAAPRDHPRRVADHSQGPAAGERHRQQRRQRRGRRRGRQRAAGPAGAARRAARVRDGGRAGRLRRRASRQRRAVVLWRVRPRAQRAIRPTSSACPCPTGWRARVLHPQVEVETGAARALLGDQVPLQGCGPAVGATSARWSPRCSPAIWRCCRGRSKMSIAEPKRAGAGARLLRGEGGRARRRRARLQPVGLGPVGVRAGRLARRSAHAGRRCDAARVQRRTATSAADSVGLAGRARQARAW